MFLVLLVVAYLLLVVAIITQSHSSGYGECFPSPGVRIGLFFFRTLMAILS